MRCSVDQIVLVIILATVTTTATAQSRDAVDFGAPAAASASAPASPFASASPRADIPLDSSRPLTRRDVVLTTAISTSTAGAGILVGGSVGWLVGYSVCASRHRDETTSRFFCLFNPGILYGAFAGSFAGAAIGASGGGVRAVCPQRESLHRAFLGSLLGSLPAIAYITSGSKPQLDTDKAFAVATPILQIAGATFAVSRCPVR